MDTNIENFSALILDGAGIVADQLGEVKARMADLAKSKKELEGHLIDLLPSGLGGSVEGGMFCATVVPGGVRKAINWELVAMFLAAELGIDEGQLNAAAGDFMQETRVSPSVRVSARKS